MHKMWFDHVTKQDANALCNWWNERYLVGYATTTFRFVVAKTPNPEQWETKANYCVIKEYIKLSNRVDNVPQER